MRTNGPRSSPLQMAAERRSWSSLSPESPSAPVGTTLRRALDACIVGFAVGGGGGVNGWIGGGVRNGVDLGDQKSWRGQVITV